MGRGEHLIRPMPADFPELGPTLTFSAACRHWKAGGAVIHRWHRENGSTFAPYLCKGRKVRLSEPAPAEFAELAPTLFIKELMARYHCGAKKVRRWLKECGVQPRPYDHAEAGRIRWRNVPRKERAKAFNRQPPPRRRIWNYTGPKRKPLPEKDWSIHGQAADHLRRYAAVYRCGERGAANPQGDHYRYGNVVLTPDELLQRAQAKGWEMAF